jgi:CHASE3 domain sensor protein
LVNTKRLGRYHNPHINYNNFTNNGNHNSSSQSHFNELASLYEDNSRRSLLDWNKPLFGNKRTSLQKVLANANKTAERATKFINKIRSSQLACANRALFKEAAGP